MDTVMVFRQRLFENIAQAIVGNTAILDPILAALLCRGHVLIEGAPGLGKTTLALALARSMQLTFSRIQLTPDVTPSDVTGFMQGSLHTDEWKFKKGVVFTNILLADEINRTSPKTQSSLLEAMEERHVTVDGVEYPLPNPFIVLATQNAVDFVGTYPLPESQLDRFFIKVNVNYPSPAEEMKILRMYADHEKHVDDIECICDAQTLRAYQEAVGQVKVSDEIVKYLSDIADATRRHDAIQTGVSSRAAIALMHAAQAWALMAGRGFVRPEDVQRMLYPVFAHRIALTPKARMNRTSPEVVLKSLLRQIPVPVKSR